MITQVKYAVLPVAGFGTRMLPLSKSVPKELLPLANKPCIQYVVEEAIAAGIEHIILVNHAQKQAIENYFDINAELDNKLRAKGKDELADSLNFLPKNVSVSSVRQGVPLGLGHAVAQARNIVGNEPFAVLLPDVILSPFSTDYKTDNLAKMCQAFKDTGKTQILVEEVADSDVHKYGIARLTEGRSVPVGQTGAAVSGFVEKPKLEDAPSNLAIVGRYVFDGAVFDYLKDAKPTVGGEIQLTDAIDALIASHGVDIMVMTGESHDAGNLTTYMQAFIEFANHQLVGIG